MLGKNIFKKMLKINWRNNIIRSFKNYNDHEKHSLKFEEDSNIAFGCIYRYCY